MKLLSIPNYITKKYRNTGITIFIIIVIIVIIILVSIYYYKSSSIDGFNGGDIVIPNIKDGLGNQLFIVAAAYSYAKDNGKTVMFDSSKKTGVLIQYRPLYLDTVFSRIPVSSISLDNSSINIVNEPDFNKHMEGNVLLTGHDVAVYPDIKYINIGYYQVPSYFNKYYHDLVELFSPTEAMKARANEVLKEHGINKSLPIICIHIRLADNLTKINHENRVYDSSEYDAINAFLPNYHSKGQIIVLSNDINRCKMLIKNGEVPITYITDKDYIEFVIMTMCTEYIASPSTFNWWGAYLNPNPNKKIHIFWKANSDYRRDFIEKYQYLGENIVYNHVEEQRNIMTCVSGYWSVTNKHGGKFNDWFKNTLMVNCPYVFYTTADQIEDIRAIRYSIPTFYINKSVEDFRTFKLGMINETDSTHCPSKELGFIWLEKVNLMLEASRINPYHSEWFCWIDAGISIYRDSPPDSTMFPNPAKLEKLSKTQVNYCSSDSSTDGVDTIKEWKYKHVVSGTTIILHKAIIPAICEMFYQYLEKCIKETTTFVCYSDQCIWTRMLVDHPELFNKVCDGYGNIIKELY